MRVALQNQRDDLLAFASVLDDKLAAIARAAAVPAFSGARNVSAASQVRHVGRLLARLERVACRHGAQVLRVWTAVSQAMQSTPRSSSLVENLNSRLRNCLSLWRHLNGGRAWLGLLQFFFNHRRFMRSRCSERIGKSPREAMTGEDHPHWLTLIGIGPLQPRRS